MPVPNPIQMGAAGIDLSGRLVQTSTVAASPATAAETVIASVTIPGNLQVASGVFLFGWAAFTVGTSGTAANLKLKQTNAAGATLAATGATTGGITAAALADINVQGVDTSPASGQVYALTLTVAAGAATSTVSGVSLVAIVV